MIGICEYCYNQPVELYECRECEKMFCADCQAIYNQFTQIDYDCCKSCADSKKENI